MNCVCFAPTGKYIASCSDDGTVRVWDAATGKLVVSPLTVDSGEYGVLSVSFSPKDNVIAAGCYNGKIHLVDAVAGEVKSTLDVDGQVNSVSFSPDGEFIAAGYGYPGNAIQIFKAQTGEKFQSPLTGHRYVPSPCIECLLL